jgi:integrase
MASELADGEELTRYVETRLTTGGRKGDGEKPATVNRFIEVILKGFALAKLDVPDVLDPSEAKNVRGGFFSRPDFDRMCAFLPLDVQDFCRFGFLTGMRFGEIASLLWDDISGATLSLRAVSAKDPKPRNLPIVGELVALIARRRAARGVTLPDGTTAASAFIFHRDGETGPVGEFRKAWGTACLKSGLSKMVCPRCNSESTKRGQCKRCKIERRYDDHARIFHDLRRSAAKRLLEAGVAQVVIMQIGGWASPSMFRRYALHDDPNLMQAAFERLAAADQAAAR